MDYTNEKIIQREKKLHIPTQHDILLQHCQSQATRGGSPIELNIYYV